MITVLYGANRFSIAQRIQALCRNIDPSGVNTTVVDDASRHLDQLRAACASIGFFGSQRLVIAHALLSSAKAGGRAKKTPENGDPTSVLAAVPGVTHLIVTEDAIDAQTERSVRRAVPDAVLERHDVPRGMELLRWIASRAQDQGATIETGAAERLLEALHPGTWREVQRRDDIPPDLYRLDAEIAKLACGAGQAGVIDASLVESLVPGVDAENIWGLTDAIGAGDARRAVREAELALANGAAPESMVAQLASQFEGFAAINAAPKGATAAETARLTGLTEGRIRQSARLIPRFPPARVSAALHALRTLDASSKLGQIEMSDGLIALVGRLAEG